jgi:hypothetical protein
MHRVLSVQSRLRTLGLNPRIYMGGIFSDKSISRELSYLDPVKIFAKEHDRFLCLRRAILFCLNGRIAGHLRSQSDSAYGREFSGQRSKR